MIVYQIDIQVKWYLNIEEINSINVIEYKLLK